MSRTGGDGLVTVVTHGHVVMKIITGQGGENAPKLATALAGLDEIREETVATLAQQHGFGGIHSLIIQTPHGTRFFCRDDDEVPERYRNVDIFRDPVRTPWCEGGTPAHFALVPT